MTRHNLADFRWTYSYPRPPVPRRPGRMREIETAILTELNRLGGRPTTVRFLFYRLVAEGIVPKSLPGKRQPAQYVSDVARDLRETGMVEIEAIVDDGRGISGSNGWTTIREAAKAEARHALLNPWTASEPVPFLVVESRSLARVLEPLVSEYRVEIAALGGQASLSHAYEIGTTLPWEARVLYLGDWDFSGGHIESSVRERMVAYANVERGTWERLALTEEQVEGEALPVIDKWDARTRKHYPAVETEALGQDMIERIVRSALDESLAAHGVTLDEIRAEERRQRTETVALLEDGS